MTEVDQSQTADSDTDSIQSWEKEITRWKPGQRPPLHHHPYDLWMNRPTARWGKCGRRLPTPEPEDYSSEEELNDAKISEETAEEAPVPRLRGGWLGRQPCDRVDEAHDAEYGPTHGSIAEEADMVPSDAASLISTEVDRLPFVLIVRLLSTEQHFGQLQQCLPSFVVFFYLLLFSSLYLACCCVLALFYTDAFLLYPSSSPPAATSISARLTKTT